MEFGGTSLVTTLPAPTIAFSPMVVLERIVTPDPIDRALFDYRAFNLPVGFGLKSSMRFVARG